MKITTVSLSILFIATACSSSTHQSSSHDGFIDQGEHGSHNKPQLSHQTRFSGILAAHNGVRAKHGLKALRWSDQLASYSQEWANHLGASGSCKMVHRTGTPPYGENLYWASPLTWSTGESAVQDVTIKDVVKVWTDEEKWYDYASNQCQPGQQCGHYTQIVWQSTTEVGCAIKVCDDKSQSWVCSYNPAGNYAGERPYKTNSKVSMQ